jgi:hypothetical protein
MLSKKMHRKNLIDMLVALQEQLDSDDIVRMLVKFDRVGIIFLLIEDDRLDIKLCEKFILDVFKYSIEREEFAIAVRLLGHSESLLVSHAEEINDYLYTCFSRSPYYFEIKLYILDKFFD